MRKADRLIRWVTTAAVLLWLRTRQDRARARLDEAEDEAMQLGVTED